MSMQKTSDFNRIARAIDFLQKNFKNQPSLEKIAAHVGLSSFHFQKSFTEWAGVSPKKFIQFLSLDHAKKRLAAQDGTLETALKTGLSGTGRLHDLFLHIEAMTPGEYKNGGENLVLSYHFFETLFGQALVASTSKGLNYLAFGEDKKAVLKEFKSHTPKATFIEKETHFQRAALTFFEKIKTPQKLTLHLKGSPCQLKVWEALLKIPEGQISTYGKVAAQIQNPKACRAVGSAVGNNPVSFLIPCHRVIQAGGQFGHYHWGPLRKAAMLGWEAAHCKRKLL
ncbi:methylated-DNA--[protein]-cysteine S-methyltransferase [Candidatus Peregrinibacteria bacterium]|nr:MAG: methylated-DNA--[protein]-cysteine S-methyltransferase [Candidatus Peregrinibacteria bacterium]